MNKPTLREAYTHHLLMDFDGTTDAYTSICQFVFPFAFEDLLEKPIDQISKEDCQRKYREIRRRGDGYIFAGTRKMANCSLNILQTTLVDAFMKWSIDKIDPVSAIRTECATKTTILKHKLEASPCHCKRIQVGLAE